MRDLNSLPLPQLFEDLTSDGSLDRLVYAAMSEDLDEAGDITTASIVDRSLASNAALAVRQPGVVAGLPVAARILADHASARIERLAQDGERVKPGQIIARISGQRRRLLGIERIVLNLLGKLSGIASLTRQHVDAIAGTNAVICDTRKTTPGLRSLEKYAVRCGGGTLHRIGLFDAALYKDNHLAGIELRDLARRLTTAIEAMRSKREVRFVEVEVDSMDQLREILAMQRGLVDIVLLDNMAPATLVEAVALRDERAPHVKLEASGGVSLTNVRAIAETGVDRISVGAITHSAPWLDVGLDIE